MESSEMFGNRAIFRNLIKHNRRSWANLLREAFTVNKTIKLYSFNTSKASRRSHLHTKPRSVADEIVLFAIFLSYCFIPRFLFFLTAHQSEIFLLAIYLIRVRRSHGEIGIKSFINFVQYSLKTPEKSLFRRRIDVCLSWSLSRSYAVSIYTDVRVCVCFSASLRHVVT